ncbi:hotdog fold thioesterase [Sphingomonas lutea]|uniref:Hotdog fold thioesterase n=1 Tax=Sphingomonas lutea TaxID=1045317 RepID=A0A7G9SKA0_9SPHN|nr:hotdog fold thioesterase [Sphingomonas lutea]QNN68275.1 hotdog fold thioesterase [Sphingomonas lutea]
MAIWHLENPDPNAVTGSGAGTMIAHLGIEIVEVGDDFLKARMPVDHRTVQPQGRLHGGASCALAETVGSVAANMVLDSNQFLAVGLEINANHIRPVKGGYVYGTARPDAIGRTTQVWTIRITDDDDRLVCISRLTMAVIAMARG